MCCHTKEGDVWLMSIKGYDIAYDIVEHIELKGYLYFIEHVHDVKN